jgi:hypothetical protein
VDRGLLLINVGALVVLLILLRLFGTSWVAALLLTATVAAISVLSYVVRRRGR